MKINRIFSLLETHNLFEKTLRGKKEPDSFFVDFGDNGYGRGDICVGFFSTWEAVTKYMKNFHPAFVTKLLNADARIDEGGGHAVFEFNVCGKEQRVDIYIKL